MRYNKGHARVIIMLSEPEIPKRSDGAIGLCPTCQRRTYFAGGFLSLLTRNLAYLADRGQLHPYLGHHHGQPFMAALIDSMVTTD